MPQGAGVSSQIIARWLGVPGYQDSEGAPRPLPRSAPESASPNFESLVSAVTSDVRPRAVLDEWLSQGIVARGPDGLLQLNVGAYLPGPGDDGQFYYFSRNLHDHIAAASANVLASGAPPFVDRSVHYDRLSAEAAATLEAAARETAQKALVHINRLAIDLTEAATADATAVHRVNFGVYIFADEVRANSDQLS
jgi:hypothetical protein